MSPEIRILPLAPRTGGLVEEQMTRGRAQGFAAGYAAGLRQAERELQAELDDRRRREQADAARSAEALAASLSALEVAIRAAEARTAPVLAEAERTLLAAAVELAEQIVGATLLEQEDSAAAALHRALPLADLRGARAVRMNPLDVHTVTAAGGAAPGVELVSDPTLAPGDAVVEFGDHEIDARVATAFARARRVLAEATT